MNVMKAALALRPDLVPVLFGPGARARLAAVAELDLGCVIEDFGAPAARAALNGTEVLISGWGCPLVTGQVLDEAPALRAVVHAGGTVKPFLSPAVWERGLLVSSAAQANAGPVAQFTLAVILLAHKRAFALSSEYRRGQWRGDADPRLGNAGRTVGVIGASRTGRAVLAMLARQGFRLLLTDPTLDERAAAALLPGADLTLVDLDRLMTESDTVTIHAPSLPGTRHLIDDRRLGLLRDGAILVNTARGALVDTDALARHCATGRIDAVLDVTEPEPLPPGHPLFDMPNVLITPHLAGALGTELSLLGDFAVAEVERLAAGQPLLGLVTEQDLGRIA